MCHGRICLQEIVMKTQGHNNKAAGCVVTFERLFILHDIGVAHVGEDGDLLARLLPLLGRHLSKQAAAAAKGEVAAREQTIKGSSH